LISSCKFTILIYTMHTHMQTLPHGAYLFLRLDDQKLLKECRVYPYKASGHGKK